MWQLHWIISLIPDAVLNFIYWAIIVAGITGVAASWIARWIPFYGQYARILKPLGVVLIILGVYLKGGYDTEMAWRDKLHAAEEKARLAEEQAKKVNTEIVTVYKDRVKVVKENVIVYQDRIKEVEKIIDKECKVAPEVITIHNDAAKNRKAGETK
jgi:hypothetical protein